MAIVYGHTIDMDDMHDMHDAIHLCFYGIDGMSALVVVSVP